MIQTEHETASTQTVGRSRTRDAVLKAMNGPVGDNSNGILKGNGNGYHAYRNDDMDMDSYAEEKISNAASSEPLSAWESVIVSIYNCVSIGVHAGLAIALLAIVIVVILGSFHDRYFVTILNRARRTDVDLLNEITYYQRKCDITDVTTSPAHHIHFGDVRDNASELFIDVDKIWDEEGRNEGAHYYDDRGVKIKYQSDETLTRRRRRFAPRYWIYEKPELQPIPKKVAEKAGNKAVDTMMKHGSVMIPKILSDATIEDLRNFIDSKNHAVAGTSDEYPMTAQKHRISYGIESTEHPAVVRALREIHNHAVFGHLIKNLVGDENPALSEITAITAWEGAEDQGWHADVKPDGNGVKFGRTYSHSYSLFLPLQETTQAMGATDLCPGTHMCADEDLFDMCEQVSVSLSEVRKARPRHEYSPDAVGEKQYQEDLRLNGFWRAGDGALLNQQGWHRGPGHFAEGAEARVVFIVSFIKRPHADDPRQLARGTYFHQKWLNWGSTWEDMVDTMANLQRPWNILRCLHLYKPSNRSWGYDLFTATSLRIANEQMGGQPEDLNGIIDNVMTPLQYPKWLQGEIDYDNENAWSMYLSGTIRKTFQFLTLVNKYGHMGLAAFLAIVSILGYLYNLLRAKVTSNGNSKRSIVGPVLASGVKRLLVTHGSILGLGCYVWYIKICSSQWAVDIDSGKTLMRPFPTDPIYRMDDPGVLGGDLSTLPRRSDVLIGTRMNSKAIGAYYTWFEHHPGNRVLDQFVEAYGGLGGFYHRVEPRNAQNQTRSGLPSGLADKLVDAAFELVTKHHGGGRFVMQDYRSGDWMVLSKAESLDYIKKRLLIGRKHTNTLGAVQEELDLLLDKQRFGLPRNALSMSWNSQLFLHDLSKELFSTTSKTNANARRTPSIVLPSGYPRPNSIIHIQSQYRLPKWEAIAPTVSTAKDKDGNRKFLMGMEEPAFRPGMEIWIIAQNEEDELDIYAGSIIALSYQKQFRDRQCRYVISLEEDAVNSLGRVGMESVSRKLLRPREPITSGRRVVATIDEELWEGTILLVLPDGSVDVRFDDGEIISGLGYYEYSTMDGRV